HVAARQRDVALFREALDELARDHFLDRARRAFDLDAVIALEQRRHLLARGAEEFRDLEDPNSCQTITPAACLPPALLRARRLESFLPCSRRSPGPATAA